RNHCFYCGNSGSNQNFETGKLETLSGLTATEQGAAPDRQTLRSLRSLRVWRRVSLSLCIQENDMKETGKINYVEIPSRNLEATKAFFTSAFGWSFVDYGPEYVAIENAGIDGGFYKSDKVCSPEGGSVLVV